LHETSGRRSTHRSNALLAKTWNSALSRLCRFLPPSGGVRPSESPTASEAGRRQEPRSSRSSKQGGDAPSLHWLSPSRRSRRSRRAVCELAADRMRASSDSRRARRASRGDIELLLGLRAGSGGSSGCCSGARHGHRAPRRGRAGGTHTATAAGSGAPWTSGLSSIFLRRSSVLMPSKTHSIPPSLHATNDEGQRAGQIGRTPRGKREGVEERERERTCTCDTASSRGRCNGPCCVGSTGTPWPSA